MSSTAGNTGAYPNGYAAGGYAPPAQRLGSGLAVTALVLGIIALVTSWTVIGGVVLGLAALIFGIVALRKVKARTGTGKGMAIAGIVTGVLGAAIAVVIVAVGVSILNSPAGKSLQQCLTNANGNQAAVQQCNQQYQNSTQK